MFKGLNFTVVPFGVDIGKKRKKILEDIIIKNEGKIIKIEKINNNLIPDFILTSKNVKNIFDIFNRKQIGSIPKEKRIEFLNIIFKRIINFEWLTQCVLQKKIVDTDDYLINIEELGIKKQSRSRVASQNYKVEGIEKLKEELCAIDHDKSFSQNQNVNRNSITNDTSIEDINILNVNNSQNSNTFTLSSFNSNAFDLDNELNDLSDEELFNKIKNMVVNKNEKDEDTNKYINSEDFNLSNSFNPSFDASQKLISKDNIISESQEIKP
jgi:hypothetical protein